MSIVHSSLEEFCCLFAAVEIEVCAKALMSQSVGRAFIVDLARPARCSIYLALARGPMQSLITAPSGRERRGCTSLSVTAA